MDKKLAPSSRVRVRGADWKIQKVTQQGKVQVIHCLGLDSLVRNQERIFVSGIEPIEVINPEDVKLIGDTSNSYKKTQLYLDARLRSLPVPGQEVDWGQHCVANPYEFQKSSARKALNKIRARLLIADAVGLGKTLQVGMILSELMKRGACDRILVLTKKSMLKQFQSELWNQFCIPLVRMDSEAISKLRTRIPSNKNPFDIYHRVILSIDTLKQSIKYEHFLKEVEWDAVVIDEAHNVAGVSQSYRLAKLLSERSRHFLLTTATPHNGKKETFARLLRLIEPYSVLDPDGVEFDVDDIKEHFVMRLKEEVREEIGKNMSPVKIIPLAETKITANAKEQEIFEKIYQLRVDAKSKKGRKDSVRLLQYGFYKLFLSAPEAFRSTIQNRIQVLKKKEDQEEIDSERKKLEELFTLCESLEIQKSSRFLIFLENLKKLGWNGSPQSPRILVFTEYVKTEKALFSAVTSHFKIQDSSSDTPMDRTVICIDGSTPEEEVQNSIEAFATGGTKVRMMIATDVASEGLNLHSNCHHIIHYDLPWSIITLIQRNGRIDRIGQKETPEVRYLKVETGDPKYHSDERVFDLLTEKVEEINRIKKEAGSVLKLFDPKQEEEAIGDRVVEGKNAEQILEKPFSLDEETNQLLEMIFAARKTEMEEVEPVLPLSEPKREIFSHREFFVEGYQYLSSIRPSEYPKEYLRVEEKFLEFTPNDEVKKRLGSPEFKNDLIYGATSLPLEVWKVMGNSFRISDRKDFALGEIARARVDKRLGHWSPTLFLSRQNPILGWLTDRLSLEFSRGEVPIINSSNLPAGTLIYLFFGQISSKAGEILLVIPHGIRVEENKKHTYMSFSQIMSEVKLGKLVNRKVPIDLRNAEILIPFAFKKSMESMKIEMEKLQTENRNKSTAYIRKFNQWKKKKENHIAEMRSRVMTSQKARAEALDELRKQLDEQFEHRKEQIHNQYSLYDEPLSELVLVISGGKE
ncbi:MAG: DEAD/DEAH box helicase [Leptospiraceae bacterium]|nr:DEAD/DEAH box helicase [Leptospiraceae bacterium]